MNIRVTRRNLSPASVKYAISSIIAEAGDDTRHISNSEARARYGAAILAVVRDDYMIKSGGGTGSDGITWKELKEETVAARPISSYMKTKLRKKAGLTQKHRYTVGNNAGILTKREQKQWKGVYADRFGRLVAMGVDQHQAKSLAATAAWGILIAGGAVTKKMVFGTRQVRILYKTGNLFEGLQVEVTRRGIRLFNEVEYAQKQFSERPAWPTAYVPQSWIDAVARETAMMIAERA